ncbi:MAG: transglutaminase-like domain-containing protein [Parcubacteria group bacterium]|jgi:hypothetical protein
MARKILSLLGKIVIVAAIAFLLIWIKTGRKIGINPSQPMQSAQEVSSQVEQLPQKINPKVINFKWAYNKKNYAITETLYGSIYDFYRTKPKEFEYQGMLPDDWKEKYFSMFLQVADGDDAVQTIADDIKQAGLKNGLSNDQLAELVVSFVQAMPYDDARAKKILSGQGSGLTNYPYETLYEGKGVCSDKSFLAYLLLKDLGYGASLFVYESENHMAVGVQCSIQYSSYESGYCYAETTTVGGKIGMIPSLNAQNNQAQTIKKLNYYGQQEQFDVKNLGPVEIYEKISGNTYAGIISTLKISQRIDTLSRLIISEKKSLTAINSQINADKADLKEMEKKLEKFSDADNYKDYNNLVPKYNDLVSKLKKEIKDYNARVNTYNQKINEYNSLIANFQ